MSIHYISSLTVFIVHTEKVGDGAVLDIGEWVREVLEAEREVPVVYMLLGGSGIGVAADKGRSSTDVVAVTVVLESLIRR